MSSVMNTIADWAKELLVGQKSTALSMVKVMILTSPDTPMITNQNLAFEKNNDSQRTVTQMTETTPTLQELLAQKGLKIDSSIIKHTPHNGSTPNGNMVAGVKLLRENSPKI